jgi:MFS family permease
MKRILADTFAALAIGPFRLLWVGTLLAFIAFFMSTVVQSVVAFELTGRNDAVGAVVFAQGLTMALLGPIGGAYADRLPKRRVIALGQAVAATVFATLAVLVATDRIHLVWLAVGALFIGVSFSFLGPARQALAVEFVPDVMRGNAMALTNVANTGSRVFGPAIAGVCMATAGFGAAGAYGVMAGFYAVSATSVAWLPRSVVRAGAAEKHVLADLGEGLRYVWAHREVRLLLLFFVTVILAGFPHITVLPGLLENQLGVPSLEVSGLYVWSAVGALSASVGVARLADSERALLVYSTCAFGFGAGLVGLSAAPSYEFAAAMMLLLGATSGGFQALNSAVIARRVEPMYIGRVMSLTMLAFAGFGLMALPYGVLADSIGERKTLLAMGVLVLCLSLTFTTALVRLARRRVG